MTIHIPQIVEDRFMIMGIPAQYHRCDTVMQIIFADTAASGRHTGSQPLNSCVRHKPDGDHIPSHLGPALTLFIKKTRTGQAMLALSEDRGAAQLMGINANRLISLTFIIGSALAAVAGMFYLMQIPAVTPTTGALPGIMAFTAAVIGGIGSIPGAMLGGILLGLVEKLCLATPLSPFTTAIEFGILILILLVKPTGLLGVKRSEKV